MNSPYNLNDGQPDYLQVDPKTLALFWFAEGTGASAADQVGTYTGSVNGSYAWASQSATNFGPLSPPQSWTNGSGVVGDGASVYVTFGALLQTPPANGTLEFWYTPAVAINSGANTNTRLASLFTVEGGSISGFDLCFANAGGQLRLVKYNAGAGPTLVGQTAAWAAGVPIHIAISWGAKGLQVWANGILEAIDAAETGAWTAGSTRNLTLLAYNEGGTISLWSNGALGVLRVSSCQRSAEEIRAAYQQRRLPPVASQYSKLGSRSTILSPSGLSQWNKTAVFEPEILSETNGTFTMFHSGTNATAGTVQIGYATAPTITGTWTDQATPILGNGAGGMASGTVACRTFARLDNGTYRVYFSDSSGYGSGQPGNFREASGSSKSAITAISAPLIPAVAGTWRGCCGNGVVFPDPDSALWYALVEWADSSNFWRIGLWQGASPDGPFSPVGDGQPLYSLQVGGGVWGGPSAPQKINGLWHLWYHACPVAGQALPTYTYHAISANLRDWTIDPYGPVVSYDPSVTYTIPSPITQSADPATPIQVGGSTYFVNDVDYNGSPYQAQIEMRSFAGSLYAFVNDGPTLPAPSASGAQTAVSIASQIGTDAADSPNSVSAQGAIATIETNLPAGDGSTAVTHNTGGADNLRYVLGSTGVSGGVVRAYLTSDYSAGTYVERGRALTGDDGRWVAPMYLTHGLAYTLTFSKPGSYQTTTATVTP